MLEIAEIKISSNKQPLKHIKTLIFLVNVTLEKPPTTLGENQFESSSLFLKNVFLQQENFSKNYSKIIFSSQQTYPFSAQRTTWKLLSFQQKNQLFLLVLAAVLLVFLLFWFCWRAAWYVCQTTASFSFLSRNLPCSLALLLPICSWKNEWSFPPFPPLI